MAPEALADAVILAGTTEGTVTTCAEPDVITASEVLEDMAAVEAVPAMEVVDSILGTTKGFDTVLHGNGRYAPEGVGDVLITEVLAGIVSTKLPTLCTGAADEMFPRLFAESLLEPLGFEGCVLLMGTAGIFVFNRCKLGDTVVFVGQKG